MLAAMSTGAMVEWVKVGGDTDGTTSYIDPPTIRKDGNFRRLWALDDLKQRGKLGEMSRRVLNEYDGKEARIRFLSMNEHSGPMASGKTLSSFAPSSDHHAPPHRHRSGPDALRRHCRSRGAQNERGRRQLVRWSELSHPSFSRVAMRMIHFLSRVLSCACVCRREGDNAIP